MEIKDMIKEFIRVFGGSEEELRVFASPGRVNLIGEHTDYNGGYVFPAALKMRTAIVMRKRDDNLLRLKATDLDGIVEADTGKLGSYKGIKWGDYQIFAVQICFMMTLFLTEEVFLPLLQSKFQRHFALPHFPTRQEA